MYKFGIVNPKFNLITNSVFINHFECWEPERKKDFIFTIAGPVNMAKTFKYFEELKEKYLNNK